MWNSPLHSIMVEYLVKRHPHLMCTSLVARQQGRLCTCKSLAELCRAVTIRSCTIKTSCTSSSSSPIHHIQQTATYLRHQQPSQTYQQQSPPVSHNNCLVTTRTRTTIPQHNHHESFPPLLTFCPRCASGVSMLSSTATVAFRG